MKSLIIGAFMLGYAGNAYSIECTPIDLAPSQVSKVSTSQVNQIHSLVGQFNQIGQSHVQTEEVCKVAVDFNNINFNDCYRLPNNNEPIIVVKKDSVIVIKEPVVKASYDSLEMGKSVKEQKKPSRPSIEDILGIDVNYLLTIQESSNDVTGKLAHAEKIYKKYGVFIKKLTDEYDIPFAYFMGKIGVEGGDSSGKNFTSKTGAKGIAMLHNGAVDLVLRQVLKSGNKSNILYKDAISYRSMEASKKKTFLDSIRNDPEKNIAVGADYTRYLLNIYGDFTFTAVAYQIGPGKLTNLLEKFRTYGKYGGEPLCEKRNGENGSYIHIYDSRVRGFIEEHNIDFVGMMSNQRVQKYFKTVKGRYDKPEEYSLEVLKTAIAFVEKNYDKDIF